MREKNSFQNIPKSGLPASAPRQLLILFGLVCAGYLLGGILSLIMIKLTPGASFSNIMSEGEKFSELLKWLQALGTFCMFALPALCFNLIVKPHRDYFYIRSHTPIKWWLLAILIGIAAIPTADIFTQINEWIPLSEGLATKFRNMEAAYNQQMMQILNFSSLGEYLISLLLIALLPALFEELLFRGALQQILIKWFQRPFWAILVASLVFSAIHGSYFGFLPRMFIGIILGYVFYLGKNIWLNISIHFLNNALVLTLLYIASKKHQPLTTAMEAAAPLYLQIIGGVLLILFFFLFVQQTKNNSLTTKSGT